MIKWPEQNSVISAILFLNLCFKKKPKPKDQNCICFSVQYSLKKRDRVWEAPIIIDHTALNVNASSSRPFDVAQIGAAHPPSLSSACQMAGGFDSPDIHQCLAVRCSRSSDLTCRLVQQNSFPLLSAVRTSPNDAAKWSSISQEPNKNAANMAQRSDTDVYLPGLRSTKRKKKTCNQKWFAKFRNGVSRMCKAHFETVPLTQLPPELRRHL